MSSAIEERWISGLDKHSLYKDDSLEDVIAEYSNMVYRLALSQVKNKSDADDVFQEVFFRYVRKEPRFESKEHQKAWFIRVTINCCKSLFSSSWRKRVVSLDDSIPYEAEDQNDLLHELQKLPQKYLAVIHLYYYEEMSIC